MRTIDATLLANQPALEGSPCRQLTIGSLDISSYLLAYDYEEFITREGHLLLTLNNATGYFNTLTGDKADVAKGADVELKRGLTVAGADKLAELPQCYLESMTYTHEGGQSLFVLDCIDWRGKLARHRVASDATWSDTSATTILEAILAYAGLTRKSGTMTTLSLDFAARTTETAHAALRRLIRKMPEFLYPGLDEEIKWKNIDGSDASVYTFGWNANHPLLWVEAGSTAWQVNDVTINGRNGATGNATDATQIALVGTRKWTAYDDELDSDAECAQRAQAELDQYEAEAEEALLVCRPCHGLELLDVVSAASPPWGGSNITGRVIRTREEWNHRGRWHQIIHLGDTPDKDPGNQPARKKKSRSGSRRSSRSSSSSRRRPSSYYPTRPGLVPIGGIVLWSGAVNNIPPGWVLCNGENGTPDLRNSFVVGAGDSYAVDDTGGEAHSNLSHVHGPGSLSTDSDSHSHDVTGDTASAGAHTHDINGNTHTQSAGTDWLATATATESDGAHTHGNGTLATDNDSHNHDVDSGQTASGGSGSQENRPPYYALAFIMRTA